jgi:hypothetical protein
MKIELSAELLTSRLEKLNAEKKAIEALLSIYQDQDGQQRRVRNSPENSNKNRVIAIAEELIKESGNPVSATTIAHTAIAHGVLTLSLIHI